MPADSVATILAPKRKRGPLVLDEKPSVKPFDVALIASEMNRAYWTAYRVTKSASLAEDAVQEAYVAMMARPMQFRGDDHMRSCFFTVVHRRALLLLRSEERRRRREAVGAGQKPESPMTTEELNRSNEVALAARSALESLPLDERTAVSMCCEQGFSLQTAAEVLGVPKPTLAGRVNRGLAKLRKILAQQGYSVATPLAVGTALSSLSLPAVPATLTAALQNLAANPALAAAKAAKLSAKALSQTAAKKTAVWFAFGLFVGVAAIAGGIWYWSNLPQNSSSVSKTETAAPTPTDSDVEIIYEDDFDGETLSDFWEKVEPAEQVTVNDNEYKSALVMRIAGPKAKVKLLPKATVTSRCIDLAQGVLEIVVKNGEANLFSHKVGTDAGSDGVSLCDENWNTATVFAHAGNTLGFALMKEKLNAVTGDRMLSAERRLYLFPSGDVLIFGAGNRFFGYKEPKLQRIRLQLYAQISDPSAYGAYCFDRVSVRVLQQLPEDIAREYADAVAKRREAETAEKR